MKRGAFILLEGMDRCGKSTQCSKLVHSLNQHQYKTQLLRFPDRETQIGQLISDYLKCVSDVDDHAIHLLFAANRWEKASEVQSLLNRGINLVVDRYAYSGMVFTHSKGNIDMEWCQAPERGLPKPDVIFYLDITPEIASKRGEFGQERYEAQSFQTKVRESFQKMYQNDHSLWQVFDANQSIESLHHQLHTTACQVIARVSSTPIQRI